MSQAGETPVTINEGEGTEVGEEITPFVNHEDIDGAKTDSGEEEYLDANKSRDETNDSLPEMKTYGSREDSTVEKKDTVGSNESREEKGEENSGSDMDELLPQSSHGEGDEGESCASENDVMVSEPIEESLPTPVEVDNSESDRPQEESTESFEDYVVVEEEAMVSNAEGSVEDTEAVETLPAVTPREGEDTQENEPTVEESTAQKATDESDPVSTEDDDEGKNTGHDDDVALVSDGNVEDENEEDTGGARDQDESTGNQGAAQNHGDEPGTESADCDEEDEDEFDANVDVGRTSHHSTRSIRSKKNSTWSSDDEESSSGGGWSDDDSGTVKSEFTDMSYGTLGSAVVVDARDATALDESKTELAEKAPAQHQQPERKAKPAAKPLTSTASKKEKEILLSPQYEGVGGDPNEESAQGKEKTESKIEPATAPSPVELDPREIDFVVPLDRTEDDAPTENNDQKTTKKGKIETVGDDDIVLDWADPGPASASSDNEDAESPETSDQKKKKKRKKKKKKR